MAHFAELNNESIVIRVIRVDDANEADGENWCNNFAGGNWKQTSYNGNMRHNYAGSGYTYDADADAFYAYRPFPSWSLDDAYIWQPPTPRPDDGKPYEWDEDTLAWVEIG
tara:strand:- start:3672 stop:4001 length:330 start_codon:yes stop_codon:yes gene_type:complete